MEIYNLGHSCFLLKNDELSILIDPYKNNSVPNLKLPNISANFVFCTHGHNDHNAKELVKIVPSNIHIDYEIITVPHDHHNGSHRGLNNMYLFNVDGYKILHTGDLGCIPENNVLEKMKNVDILLAPINGFYTISSEELKQIVELIKPRIVIPMHYYKKENNSGYPDDGQIDIFKKLFNDFTIIDDYKITVDEQLFNKTAIIFKKELQEK